MASASKTENQSSDYAKTAPASHLLVVDDEESVALTVSEVLRFDGYRVDTAMSGDQAIECLKETCYDLVLTDLHMEGGDGISVLAEVRRCSPLTITIVLTGFASLESAIAAMRQGAYDYLIKPCIIDDMKHTIQRGLEHRRLMLAEQEARANLELLNRELERRVEERTSELKRVNDDLTTANRAKDIFFATLSHELRTPLTPILGWSRLLRLTESDPNLLQQGLDAIERNARLQTRLIDDLLDISRIVSGKLCFDVEPTDLCGVVSAAIETVRETASHKGIALKASIPDDSIIVEGSPVRLQQIVWNLLSNAVKFTESGEVSVDVFERSGDARVVVTDTGVGISAEFLPHVFEPFQQADGSTTRQHGGLGLGLAIVRRLAEMHGGRVFAESEGAGRGSRFTVSIPTAISARRAREKKNPCQEARIPDPVLIVEDSMDTLDLLSTFFESRGCRVMTAGSVKEATALAQKEKPGIILSDIGMPDEDGYQLLARLRLEPGLEATPAIAISGYATHEDYTRAIESGFSAHLAKPVDLDELLAVIQKLNS